VGLGVEGHHPRLAVLEVGLEGLWEPPMWWLGPLGADQRAACTCMRTWAAVLFMQEHMNPCPAEAEGGLE
jgi:hypothetical protein